MSNFLFVTTKWLIESVIYQNYKNYFVLTGDHITFVAHSKGVELALDAANELSSVGIEAEVINLRSLRPLDITTIIQSVIRTNHIISIEQGWPYAGIGSEISASIMESMFLK